MTRLTRARHGILALLTLCVWAAGARPVVAQGPAPEPRFGYRGFVDVGSQMFAASDTFDAILGADRGTFVGGGGQARWKDLIFELTASRFTGTGERVFVSDGDVFRLGIPTTITIRPVEFTAAYRLPHLWRFRPYGGGGVGKQRYQETSEFAEPGEDLQRSDTSYHLVGGAEIRMWRWMAAGAEVRYRTVRGAVGEGGVSKEFGETDLGGASIRLRVIVIGR